MKSVKTTVNIYIPIATILIVLAIYFFYNFNQSVHFRSLNALGDPIVHDPYLMSVAMCTQASYDRGVGTIPIVGACPPGTTDSGTDCFGQLSDYGLNFVMSDIGTVPVVSIREKGCCNMAWTTGCNTVCKVGEIDDSCTCRSVSCGPDRDYIDGLCYPKCSPGWYRDGLGCRVPCGADAYNIANHCYKGTLNIVKSLAERQYCIDGKEMQDGLCYTKCQQTPTLFKGIATTCWSDVTTKPRESRISPLQPIQVVAKQTFTRNAIFEGESTPPVAC